MLLVLVSVLVVGMRSWVCKWVWRAFVLADQSGEMLVDLWVALMAVMWVVPLVDPWAVA